MARWAAIQDSEPDFARRVQERFDANRHKVIATLRSNGSPRISGIEAQFKEGDVSFGMMRGSRKADDLHRDPRCALHSGTRDPSEQPGEVIDAKLSGNATEVEAADHYTFNMDVTEIVLIALGDPADHLLIEIWRESEGLTRVNRY